MAHSIKASSFAHLLAVLDQLQSQYRSFCPTVEDGVENYLPLDQMDAKQRETSADLAFRNTPPLGSIKSFLFPDSEIYIKFARKGKQVEMEELEPMAPQIILGVKPCDLKSVEIIDKVFLADPVDTLYQEKRDKTTIISTICPEMGPNCNCLDFGISPIAPAADLIMIKGVDQGSEVYLKSNSTKGDQLIQELLTKDGIAEVDSFPKMEEPSPRPQLSPEKLQERMDELFESPLWENLAMLCLGCGTCTYYCPTCHCYDIRDFNRKGQGVRYRTWDSCMFANFTNMAGGHNPRPSRKDRIQNRFFHKLNYFVKKQGELACVGCGRCAEHCPVGISINTVLKKIGGDLHV